MTTGLAQIEKEVQASKMSWRFEKGVQVAVICAPSIVVEAIVWKASQASGIEMDWGFVGGRAFVVALGDKHKARSALFAATPSHDLTLADL